MAEPITMYDADGNEVTVYGHYHAAQEVKAGRLFQEPPASGGDTSEDRPANTTARSYNDLTVDEVLSQVELGVLSAEEALEREKAGKNRVTLIEALERKED